MQNLVGEERSAALLLATRTLSVVGCGNGDAACAVVSPGFNLHAKVSAEFRLLRFCSLSLSVFDFVINFAFFL